MSKPKSATDCQLPPHWKVRIVVDGNIVHVITQHEPSVTQSDGKLTSITMSVIEGTPHGDTIGFIDMSAVTHVSWRFADND